MMRYIIYDYSSQVKVFQIINKLLFQIEGFMFTFKRRAATLKKLAKMETIHSFYQERAKFKNALSLTLRKSCKQFCSTPQKNNQNTHAVYDKLDPLTQLTYPSLYKNKKMSLQKLIENRKILNERGKKINQSQKNNRLKMIALQEYNQWKNENNPYLWRHVGAVKIKMGKNGIKTDLSCRGLNFQMNEASCDEKTQLIRRIKKIRNGCARMTEPFDKYKRMSTMPDFKQDKDIQLCPWQAAE